MFWKKRGFNQVDWSISLGIFLLYIAWFFVIVKPQVLDAGVFSPNIEEIKSTFFELTEKEINLIPVFVSSENTLNNKLIEIEVDFLEDWNYGFITSNPYIIDDGVVYVVDDISNSTNIYYLVEASNITYDSYDYQDVGIVEGNGSVNPNSNLTVFFNTEITSIYFDNEERISSIDYYQNSNRLSNSNFSFDNRFLFGDFMNIFDTFSTSDKLITKSNEIQTRIKKLDKFNDINVSIEYSLNNYTDYYINNLHYGTIDSIEDECDSITGKKAKLVDDVGGVYFVFNKNIEISVCNIDGITINFNFSNQNIKYVTGFIDDNDSSNIPDVFSDYNVSFGMGVKKEYSLISSIENLTNNDFALEDFTVMNGFRLRVYNTTSLETTIRNNNIITSITEGNNLTNNIFSKDETLLVQDDYGNVGRMTLNVKVW